MQQTSASRQLETPQPYVVTISPSDVPRTSQEVRALRIKLGDLRSQLQDAAERRHNISGQLPDADPAARPGIVSRMGELDARIMRIEKDISTASALLSSAPPSAIVSASPPRPEDIANRVSKDIVPIIAILAVFVLGPLSFAMSRMIWRRGVAAPARSALPDAAVQNRLEQLQQSVDTIALEVERISEGQRFVTKLLSERDRSLGAGAAESVRVGNKAAVPSERG